MTKKTKIVATISDLKCDIPFLTALHKAGVNVFRMNTAHQTPEDTLKAIKNMRAVSNKIPVIVDTKGPEIRTTSLRDDAVSVKRGDKIKFIGGSDKQTSSDAIYLNYDKFHKVIEKGSQILYDDGELEFTVVDKKPTHLVCRVENTGLIKGKKSINVPGKKLDLPSLTEKDKMYVEFSAKHNVDFIAHSFIRNKGDLMAVQSILDKHKSKTQIIAKIENREGVDNIDEILDHCAGIMVARGDLAIEIPAAEVPPIQKDLIKRCIKKRKVVITATQMLHTMIENPRPTRAEVSDIANAVYDGTDSLMLSGETAYGKYPLEAVKVMNDVALEVERVKPIFKETVMNSLPDDVPAFLSKSAIRASLKLPIRAIITDTLTGRTAKYLSAFRGNTKIYALCYKEEMMRSLAFSYGVYANLVPVRKNTEPLFKEKIRELVKQKLLKMNDTIILLSGEFGATPGASKLQIAEVKNLLK
ncbi:MAG: pyruvate kinase [Nanoarchaeota archaeon]|jgi:pyruvate kinase|nr:pyruvate kinase [Nanoarchaeota archaeon]